MEDHSPQQHVHRKSLQFASVHPCHDASRQLLQWGRIVSSLIVSVALGSVRARVPGSISRTFPNRHNEFLADMVQGKQPHYVFWPIYGRGNSGTILGHRVWRFAVIVVLFGIS